MILNALNRLTKRKLRQFKAKKVSRNKAIAILQRLMPDYRNMNYAEAAKRSKKASSSVVNYQIDRRNSASPLQTKTTTTGETTIDDTAIEEAERVKPAREER